MEAVINPAVVVAATAECVAKRVFFPMHCRQFLPNWPGPIQRGPGRFLFWGWLRKTEIRVERPDAFFKRGRKYGALADRGARIPASRVVAFEDVESLVAVLTGKRILLIRQLKETPASITELAKKLKRDRRIICGSPIVRPA